MEPAKWCLLGLEESIHSIDAAQKHYEKNPSDSRIFSDVRKNIIEIFGGLTQRVVEQYNIQNSKLKQIKDAFNSKTNLSPEQQSAKIQTLQTENDELQVSLKRADEQITGYRKDLKKVEEKVKHLSADAAHSKCERCKNKPRDVLFLPCNHFITCEDCSNELRNCFYCDTAITESIVVEY